jgi:hypothetical protein
VRRLDPRAHLYIPEPLVGGLLVAAGLLAIRLAGVQIGFPVQGRRVVTSIVRTIGVYQGLCLELRIPWLRHEPVPTSTSTQAPTITPVIPTATATALSAAVPARLPQTGEEGGSWLPYFLVTGAGLCIVAGLAFRSVANRRKP